MSRKHSRKKDKILMRKRMEAPPTYPEMEAQAEPEPELEPENASVRIRTMSIDAILGQLADMKDNAESRLHTPREDTDDIWLADIAAIEAATAILSALQDEGVEDAEKVKDLIFDYELSQRELRELHRKFIEPAKVNIGPDKYHGVMQTCPECGARLPTSVFVEQFYCRECGKRVMRPGEAIRMKRRESP